MKKILSAVMALTLAAATCVSLSGCGKKSAKYTVGICQLVQHDALDAATKGFKDVLKEKLGDDVEFDEQNAANDSATCATIANQFVSNKVDLIMANATPALQAAAAATADIPVVATSITDYATALEISDWTGKTGTNITGSSDLAPLKEQAEMIKELFPEAKKVGILYNSGEANSKYQATEVTKALKDLGIEAKEYTSADSNDLASVVTTACAEVDVIYIPTDNTMASNTGIVNNIAEPAKVPVVAGEVGICKGCGVATLSIDYYSIGKKAGEMAYEILVNGAKPGDMEIEYADELTKQYMASRSKTLGITVPDTYEAIAEDAE
ncbi:MAG: ABC transporter substrate-binding protein [Acutalibacteraceae bacterium]|nr:ABC transporter substrate-binding protein [Acutalibacteraceae bacterium]